MTATSAVVDPDISEKNMLKTTTTCDSPPLMCPTSDSDKLAIRTTTFAELMSSPTRRKNGIASNASESTPSNTCELERPGRLLGADFRGGRLHPLLLVGGKALPQLVADEQQSVIGLIFGHRKHGCYFIVLI